MKISIRTKLLLSYAIVIFVTLFLLGYFTDIQVGHHFENFYQTLGGDIPPQMPNMPLPPKGNDFIHNMQNSILWTAIGAGIIAIIASFILTSYITKPIKKLIDATKAIALGKYEKRVEASSNDELGELTKSLNVMAESLENQRYLQKQLITNVAHELATPLTSISGYLEALTDKVIKSEDKKSEAYMLMKEETDRLKDMLDEVRTLSVLQENQSKIVLAKVDAKDLTAKIIKQMAVHFKAKQVAIKLESTLEKEIFLLDKNRYTQILINLLNNALKYSKAKTTVTILLSNEKEKFTVAVKDQGIGIPKKDLPYIFERFYRVDASRQRGTGGLGIGLAIVKELVSAHGGHIFVETREGKGTTFTCVFPQT
ncbi:MAG: HAMP domain-containing sensor histidine kinase [Candidatus Gracilibacteria bacterium]|jgi:signal transduction histidine kinase